MIAVHSDSLHLNVLLIFYDAGVSSSDPVKPRSSSITVRDSGRYDPSGDSDISRTLHQLLSNSKLSSSQVLSNDLAVSSSSKSRQTSETRRTSRGTPLLSMMSGGSRSSSSFSPELKSRSPRSSPRFPLLRAIFGKSGSSGSSKSKPKGLPIIGEIISHILKGRKSSEDTFRKIVEAFFSGLFKMLGSLG